MRNVVSVEEAASIIASGRIIAYPTETFYALGADPFSQDAVDELLEIKGRSQEQGISLIIASFEVYSSWVAPSESAYHEELRTNLINRFWPGPLTAIVNLKPEVSQRLANGIASDDGSVALRVSSHIGARNLMLSCKGALTATSANLRGRPPCSKEDEVRRVFPDLPIVASDILQRAVPTDTNTQASTILDLRQLPFKIIRRGAIKIGCECAGFC